MRISVIMPAYNAARYVESAATSILDQSHRDIELIVVDDGSTDDTPAIVDALAERDGRVVVVHQANGGEAAARNTGLDRATGELVTWQDADDLCTPNRLEVLHAALVEAGAEYAHSDVMLIDGDGAPIGYLQARRVRGDEVLPFMLATGTPFGGNQTLLMRRELFDGLRCVDMLIGTDTDIAAKVTAGRRGVYVPEPLYLYRRHEGSVTVAGVDRYHFEELGLLVGWATPLDLVPEARWDQGTSAEQEAVARAVIGLKLVRRGDVGHGQAQFNAMLATMGEVRPGIAKLAGALVKLARGNVADADAMLREAEGPPVLVANYRAEVLALGGHRSEAMREVLAALRVAPFSLDAAATLRGLAAGRAIHLIDGAVRRYPDNGTVLPGATRVIAEGRNAEQADARAACNPMTSRPAVHRPGPLEGALRLALLMPRTDACGGARIILEHANRLHDLGCQVTVLAHDPPPLWFSLRATFVEVPWGQPLHQAIPPCDVIVAGYWDQVAAARALGIAPVVHLEQGPFHLFDQLAPDVEALVAGSLARADLTLTVGSAGRRALAERYGVTAEEVPNAIDPELFHPGPPRPPGGRRSVLFVGWDGDDFKGIDVLRKVAEGLQATHPDVGVVWVTARPPEGPPLGTTIVDPAQPLLASLYREASVYVGGSRFETFPLPPLEAMASGTPVVSTANRGVLAYAVDGENALLAPVDDVEGLLARVRAVLDDAGLAARLRAGGLQTSAGFAWPAIIDRVHARYRELAATVPVVPARATVAERGWSFARPEDAEAFAGYLATCPTSHLAIPVSQPVLEGHRLVRWRTVATIEDRPLGTTKVYLPARDDSWVEDSTWQEGVALLRDGAAAKALEVFSRAYVAASPGVQAVVGRWVVLALIRAGRAAEAVEVSAKMAVVHPTHPDYFYLSALAAKVAKCPSPASELLRVTRLLGNGARHEEWFEDPHTLTRVVLGG